MRDTFDRERLADLSHRKGCAHHKGRNHWANWKRRAMQAAKQSAAKISVAKRDAQFRRHKDAVRLYWAG